MSSVRTLPKMLNPAGYKAIAVVSNYVLRKNQGWANGFKIYDDTMDQQESTRKFPEGTAKSTTDRAIELIKRFRKDQLFMWIHYQDPHGPYTPPPQFAEMFFDPNQKPRNLRPTHILSGRGGIPSYQMLPNSTDYHYYVSQYNAEIRYQDEHFKRLLDSIKQFGLYDDALFIFTSDHGEDMGEHDYYFTHGENLYNSLLNVPLIIKYGNEFAGTRKGFVQHLDIVPTILKFADVDPDAPFRGEDLTKQHKKKSEIFAEMYCPIAREVKRSLIYDDFKIIYTDSNEKYELYNLVTDQAEDHNLINESEHRCRATNLKHRLKRLAEEDLLKLNITQKPRKPSQEEIEKLKSLGYTR